MAARPGEKPRVHPVESFRGNYLLDALIALGIVKSHKGQMELRLHPAYELTEVEAGVEGVKAYARTLAGEVVDYAVKRGKTTYHADTLEAALAGLQRKIERATLKAEGKVITYGLCRDLGFCDAGIRAFARAYGLDLNGEYTADEIAEKVRKAPQRATAFVRELLTLARALNYSGARDLLRLVRNAS